jgi:serine/threonine-protein kinase
MPRERAQCYLQQAMAASMLGQQIGRYRLIEELGRGGMATVYRADDPALGRAVAVKVLHRFLVDHAEMRERFEREARAIAALRHPNIVEVYDFSAGDGDTPPYLVTELVRGRSLSRFLAERGVPLPEVAALIGVEVARALAAAHAAGIVHRDVKPDNILIGGQGRVVLGDFGIARMLGETTVTATGALVGSPAYMSPEQARGQDVDLRSDVFALGTTLYHLVSGTLPFGGKSPLAIIGAILGGHHAPLGQAQPGVPGDLERVVERCLAPDPAARYASAAEAGDALSQVTVDAGLVDGPAELRSYFAEPGEYNAALVPRLHRQALTVARQAAARGELLRALRACDRALALAPADPEARALLAELGARGRWWRAGVAAAAAGVIVLLGSAMLALRSDRGGHAGLSDAAAPGLELATPALALVPSPPDALPAASADGTGVPAGPSPPQTRPPAPVRAPVAAIRPGSPRGRAAPAPPPAGPPESLPASPAMAPDAAPADAAPARARLTVRAIPYCRPLLVDGREQPPPFVADLAPGHHELRCVHPERTRTQTVTLVAGANPEVVLRVFDDVLLDASEVEGELWVDGRRCGARCRAPVGAVHLELRQGGRAVEQNPLVDVPPSGCRVRAAPLRCAAEAER